ncbi:leucine-rich repeat protein [Artemisia annua]|uniref:Leucine-rich repeat protein n=1 Tax=Artemisia annua TaxID=35608 RepID=A0A2U1QBC4_ARTAN|nr:leucine-rich repeat protein [Artemisia annua]
MANHRSFLILLVLSIYFVANIHTCLSAPNISAVCSKQERLALLKFKHSVYDVADMLSSWVGDDCCQWERVHCDKVTGKVESLHLRGSEDHIISDEYGFREMLVGNEVSSSLRHLRNLKFLDLSANYFQGSQIPEFIGSFKQLSYLNLSYAHFSGVIPPHIGNLSNIKVLDLGSGPYSYTTLMSDDIHGYLAFHYSRCGLTNAYFGTLSNSSTTLANVKHLDLGGNHFKELRLSNCGLQSMHLSFDHLNSTTISIIQHLDLSQNLIEGRFPSALTNMSSLLSVDLSSNMLNSSVPIMPKLLRLDLSWNNFEHIEDVGIWRQCHLKELTVSDNYYRIEMTDSPENVSECSQYAFKRLHLDRSLKGAFHADSLGRMTNLRGLSLSGNNLTGPFPESLGRLRLLEELDLSNNQLTGPIPESIGRLVSLQLFSVSSNSLNGTVPVSIGQLTKLQYLYLFYNHLTGSIPESIGQLTKLRYIDIYKNSIEGVITEAHFAKLSMMKYLFITSNSKLTVNVSREWKPPFQLIEADLSSIKILNGFPQWLRTQKKLKVLSLSNVSITGPLPTWLRKMPVTGLLDLSHNKLTGPLTNLPDEGSAALFLQDNLFNESIPISLCRWTDMEYLDLSRNRLTGRIPECLGNMWNLVSMQFSSNQLSGVIPSSILPQSSMLRTLNLNDNHFTGELPRELWSLRGLNILDLGDNAFSGNISEWIGENLTNLGVFRLHKNNFTGSIPRSLCNNPFLQILDVAHNNLMGPIPHCLGKLNGMITHSSFVEDSGNFSLEENLKQVMKGVSLEYTKTFRYVINMDLSSNNLVGEIPVELMSLSALVGLNLSNNHLNGGIPDSIGNMKALNSLDFSGNQLTGPIPPSITALNFLSYLNLSHNNLSGQIPTGNQLQTLTDPSIYVGNRDLCGAPLPKNCSNNEDQTTMHKNSKAATHKSNKVWFYIDIMCGFAAGFCGVIGVLLFKKHWRHKLFKFAEETVDKMKRGRESA